MDLVRHHLLDSFPGWLEIGPGVELFGMLGKILADAGRDSQTDVRIHVDLAHPHARSLAQQEMEAAPAAPKSKNSASGKEVQASRNSSLAQRL